MLRFHRRFLLLSGGAALAACASPRSLGPLRPTVSFEALARQMKYDVGTYIYQHQDEPAVYGGQDESAPEAEVENARIRADPTKRLMTEKEKCHAQLAFTIYSVRITTIALVNNSFTPEAGLQVPLNVGTIDLSVKAGLEGEDTITTSLEIVPDENDENYRISKPMLVREFSGTPIADTLNALRTDLLRTADTEPCFDFGPGGDQKNSVKWGFAIKNSATVGGKLSIALFAIGAGNTLTQSVTNSIEVSFNGHGGFG